MTTRTLPHTHRAKEIWQRSISKTISYVLLVLLLDIAFLFTFSDQTNFAFGYLAICNIYLVITYFFHERLWDGVTWGKFIYKKGSQNQVSVVSKKELSNYEETL